MSKFASESSCGLISDVSLKAIGRNQDDNFASLGFARRLWRAGIAMCASLVHEQTNSMDPLNSEGPGAVSGFRLAHECGVNSQALCSISFLDLQVAQYIGETCRYLLSSPERPEEKKHKVRLMFGNGLRPQIWAEFVKRFGITQIAEFYGATEGNANIINTDGTIGAVGFVSILNPDVYPVALIKVNEATGEPIRGPDGLCQRCQPGETGMFVGKIVRNHPVRDFHGYADESATKKKVADNVFQKGDSCFLSGDIMVMDELGYLFFKDRTGDTFRWKGENVSTTEVEAVVSNASKLKDATVYGVEVTGSEGRAGMAAILDNDGTLDLDALATGLKGALPAYARPLFIRAVKEMDMTGTYKLRKVDFQKEGFDPSKIKDKLFLFDSKTEKYIPLTKDVHNDIVSGKIRL